MKIMGDTKVTIRITRVQDGEKTEDKYEGGCKEINGRLHVTFTELQEDGSVIAHLLKVSSEGMEWARSGAVKNKVVFKAGTCLPFLFATSQGDIKLDLTTHDYSYTKKDTHMISMSYTLSQGGCPLSEYETEIVIFTD